MGQFREQTNSDPAPDPLGAGITAVVEVVGELPQPQNGMNFAVGIGMIAGAILAVAALPATAVVAIAGLAMEGAGIYVASRP